MIVLLPKKKQIKKVEPIVSEAPPPSLKPLIDKVDVDNKNSRHLGKSLLRRNRIELLLKLIKANPHVHLNYSTKILQLGEAFLKSTQPSTKINLLVCIL